MSFLSLVLHMNGLMRMKGERGNGDKWSDPITHIDLTLFKMDS